MGESVQRRSSRSRQKPLVSVLTPTIIGREHFLGECVASVAAQTFRRYEHLILLDDERRGCATTMNELAGAAQGEWLLILADDDVLLPRCLELLHARALDGEVIYSPPLVWGEDAAQFCASPPNIPAVALISKELWDRLGGYSLDAPSAEDNAFWRLAESRGTRFVRVDQQPTWVYRFHGGNKSRVAVAS